MMTTESNLRSPRLRFSPLDVGDMELLPGALFDAPPPPPTSVGNNDDVVHGGGHQPAAAAAWVAARQGVHGDGSCFFHSLCAALNTDNYLLQDNAKKKEIGTRFRCAFVKRVTRERWDSFLAKKHIKTKVTFEKLKTYFCDNRHWADELMIRFVSDVLKLNLVFLNTETRELYCGVHGLLAQPLILILWVRHSHFEPIFRVHSVNAAAGTARVQFVFDDPKRDRDVVDAVARIYNKTCGDKLT